MKKKDDLLTSNIILYSFDAFSVEDMIFVNVIKIKVRDDSSGSKELYMCSNEKEEGRGTLNLRRFTTLCLN